MQYRRLGKSGGKVSAIGLGGASISGEGGGYGFGEISESLAIDLIRYSYEKGINLFDTAPLYGKGLSEQRLGKALKEVREEVFIVSKCGLTWKPSGRVDHTNDPRVCQRMLEQSLRDLQSDYMDLYMVHYPDPKFDIRVTLEVLARAQREGKIGLIGLCNTNETELALAEEVADIAIIQNEFNFFSTEQTKALFPIIKARDMGLMGWGTLHKGILTGTAMRGRQYSACDVRSWAPWFRKNSVVRGQMKWSEEVLLPFLREHQIAPASFALQFALSFNPLSTALCGFRSRQQLDILLQGLDAVINKSIFSELRKLYDNA